MKVALFGAGNKSVHAAGILREKGYETVFYIEDNDYKKIGNYLDGNPIISVYKAKQLYEDGKIAKILISTEYHKKTVEDMVWRLRKAGIIEEDICLLYINFLRGAKVDENEIFASSSDFVQLFGLNYHVTDNCNMNCELCCHSSQFVTNDMFFLPEQFETDICRLKELIPNLHDISLLGGEPLLHPDLSEFIQIARQYYPYTTIILVTNGILLRSISDEMVNCIRDNNVVVSLSLYPPLHISLDDFVFFFKEKGLNWTINRVDGFFKKYSDTPLYDPVEMSSYCGYCPGIRNGKMARCIDSMTIEYANDRFSTNIPSADCIDIHDTSVTGKEIIDFLKKPMKICSYCANKQTLTDLYEWRQVTLNTVKEDVLQRG